MKEKDSEAVSGEAEMDPQQKEAAPAKGKKKATKKKDEEEDDVVDEGEDAGGDDKVDDGTPKKRGRTAAKPKAAASAASKKGSKKKDKSGDDEASQKDGETKKNEVPVMTELPKGSLKILSWNVGGFRAAIRKGALEYLESHQSDILFINETKVGNQNKRIHPRASVHLLFFRAWVLSTQWVHILCPPFFFRVPRRISRTRLRA